MPEYFTHDFTAHDDPKLKMLLLSGGYKFVGMYWTMLELIGGTEHRGWPDTQLNTLARAMQVKLNTLTTLVDALLNIGLMRHEHGFYYSSGLLKRMIELDSKRDLRKEVATKAAKERLNRKNENAPAFNPESVSNANEMPTNLTKSNLTYTNGEHLDEFTEIVQTLNSGRDPEKPNNVTYFERGKLKLLFNGYGPEKLREAVESVLAQGWRGTPSQIEDWLKGKRPEPKRSYEIQTGNAGNGVVL